MKYHYADADGQSVGPLDLAEIKALIAAGKLASDPQVKPEGSDNWIRLSSVSETVSPTSANNASSAADSEPHAESGTPAGSRIAEKIKNVNSALLSEIVAKLLVLSRKILHPKLMGTVLGKARDWGHYVVLAAAALTVIYALFASIKENRFAFLPLGLVYLIILTISQFAAQSFLGAGEKLIQTSRSRIATSAFLDCFGMLSLSLAVIFLLFGIFSAIQLSSLIPLFGGALLGTLFAFIAGQMLHPSLVNVEIGEASAGEEAIGLMMLFLKVGLKLVPLGFFLVSAFGALAILAAFINNGQAIANLAMSIPWIQYGSGYGFAGSSLVIIACLLPMLAYLSFLVFYLGFDCIRALLSIPGKLDALKK